ncbi:NAD(P)H-hydrate dehydratase [Verrucomicrobiota bacterium]
MKFVSTEQMRELDRKTIEKFGVSGETLMERAGIGVADAVLRLAGISRIMDPFIRLLAGKGNNGGDAFMAARYLVEQGLNVEVWIAGQADAISGDALTHFNMMKSAGVSLCELPEEKDWNSDSVLDYRAADILVDGILGTGISGAARGPAKGAINYINAHSENGLVVSIDVPSGMNSDTGKAEGEAVRADITVTMGLPKLGLSEIEALDYVGSVEVVDIGIPDELVGNIQCNRELITAQDLSGTIKRRAGNSHKGNFGHVLLVGGASGYAGAIALAARAAMRSGAGLVTVLAPGSVAPVVAGIAPEAMVHWACETEAGSLSSDCLSKWDRDINDFDAVLIGPGITTHDQSRLLVEHVLEKCRKPLVLDADALNVLAGNAEKSTAADCPVVITPHPGEMARLLGCSSGDVQADRCGTALKAVNDFNAVTVLKGARTVVVEKGQVPHINSTGNPGMASGGTGDVLSGLITGLIAQGLKPFDAARIAVYLHGRAGDNIARNSSQAGMIAGDIIEELPNVLREITAR